MPPSYRASDHDMRLTPIAREARPIIQSLDRYYQAHGHCPRPSDGDLDEIRSSLPSGLVATLRDRQTRISRCQCDHRLVVLLSRQRPHGMPIVAQARLGSCSGVAAARRGDKMDFRPRRRQRRKSDRSRHRRLAQDDHSNDGLARRSLCPALRFLLSMRRSRDALVGLVGRRRRGTTAARRMSSSRRSSASTRLRPCVR